MTDDTDRVIVLNPVSGSGEHAEAVRKRADLGGFAVRETDGEGDGIEFAQEAARGGASLIAAAGGDGTLNEVVAGVREADALDDVAIGVIPTGTGNNFASNVGIEGIDEAFDAIESGQRRRVDLGVAGDRPFVNSCVGGLTADASEATTPELKKQLGVLAYVVTTLRTVSEFDRLRLTVSAEGGDSWSGEALAVLVGNGRRFTARGSRQAHLEDGRLEVTIVEDVTAGDLTDAVAERVLDGEAATVTRLLSESLELSAADPVTFSLDGETVRRRELSLSTLPGALELVVGETYDPDPGPP